MPELPDVVIYLEAIERRTLERRLEGVRLANPFLLRSVEPPIERCEKRTVRALRRIGKRIAIGLEGGLWFVLHLMIAGRLHWKAPDARLAGKRALAAFDFADGSLVLTEAGSKKRASLHLVQGEQQLAAFDRGGLEVLSADLPSFARALTCENHTLKRTLTDPRLFSGIGNAYSDEILHRARLSPVALTRKLNDDQIHQLFDATRQTLAEWIDRLRAQTGGGFPEKVSAFRPEMAVHGKFGQPCPDCGTTVRRIRYADNETNYCPRCQTGGRLLADRSLSRLLKNDWPRSVEELQ